MNGIFESTVLLSSPISTHRNNNNLELDDRYTGSFLANLVNGDISPTRNRVGADGEPSSQAMDHTSTKSTQPPQQPVISISDFDTVASSSHIPDILSLAGYDSNHDNNDDDISDEDEDADADGRFVYSSFNFDFSEDQQTATQELLNLKLDLGFASDENGGSGGYILSERVRLLNEELAKEPFPPDTDERHPAIRFKDDLVDFIAPTPEHVSWWSEEDDSSHLETPLELRFTAGKTPSKPEDGGASSSSAYLPPEVKCDNSLTSLSDPPSADQPDILDLENEGEGHRGVLERKHSFPFVLTSKTELPAAHQKVANSSNAKGNSDAAAQRSPRNTMSNPSLEFHSGPLESPMENSKKTLAKICSDRSKKSPLTVVDLSFMKSYDSSRKGSKKSPRGHRKRSPTHTENKSIKSPRGHRISSAAKHTLDSDLTRDVPSNLDGTGPGTPPMSSTDATVSKKHPDEPAEGADLADERERQSTTPKDDCGDLVPLGAEYRGDRKAKKYRNRQRSGGAAAAYAYAPRDGGKGLPQMSSRSSAAAVAGFGDSKRDSGRSGSSTVAENPGKVPLPSMASSGYATAKPKELGSPSPPQQILPNMWMARSNTTMCYTPRPPLAPSTPRLPPRRSESFVASVRCHSARGPAPPLEQQRTVVGASERVEEVDRQQKRDEANAAFVAWLRQKQAEQNARRRDERSKIHSSSSERRVKFQDPATNTDAQETGETTTTCRPDSWVAPRLRSVALNASILRCSPVRPSKHHPPKQKKQRQRKKEDNVAEMMPTTSAFDEWIREKTRQHREEQRLLEAQRADLYGGNVVHRPEDNKVAFRKWLRKKRHEAKQRSEQERQRASISALTTRQSQKSKALMQAMGLAYGLHTYESYSHR